ncbi:D-tyrosyl-tRNA(Tyr) deacylase [Candidatus Bipolaricaulota bacterium]|nr:D-tyrosyl-tRNA(Tyr) deacylase [Candidatus Bipolaricaulota bacterium]
MRIVLQRVSRATVRVEQQKITSIDKGIVLLIGIGKGDEALDLPRLAQKVVDLRIFEDQAGKMNRSLRDVEGEILAVSQFTLYGDTKKGRRPSFSKAASPQEAKPLFDAFISALKAKGVPVKTGVFGARMEVELVNDGPVTFILELASHA